MTFDEILAQVLDLLRRQERVSYRALKRRFDLDDEYIEDLKAEIIQAQRLAVDEDGAVLVWTGEASGCHNLRRRDSERSPLAYTPKHLAEKILTSRAAPEGERKHHRAVCRHQGLHGTCWKTSTPRRPAASSIRPCSS